MPGFFSNTLAVLRREIHRVARQPMYWLLTVILPIVAFAFFAVLLYKGVARDIPIAVVDQDNSTLSRKVTQMIDATPTAWVAYGVQGMEEAERLVYSSTKPGRISLYRCGGRNPPPGAVLRPIPTAPDGRSETP